MAPFVHTVVELVETVVWVVADTAVVDTFEAADTVAAHRIHRLYSAHPSLKTSASFAA